ncbi:MAG TPA: hypothetical protein EYN67_16915 [Flavobacteriales bacterium]|nr:hypothetical protein [Flavobacteriales bacterium]
MFLIEYDKGLFIDGKSISWVKITPESVMCTQVGGNETIIEVAKDYQEIFVKKLRVIDGNGDASELFREQRK